MLGSLDVNAQSILQHKRDRYNLLDVSLSSGGSTRRPIQEGTLKYGPPEMPTHFLVTCTPVKYHGNNGKVLTVYWLPTVLEPNIRQL